MADVVNLRTARKQVKRQQQDLVAEANRLSHGQPKRAKALETARRAKAERDLEQHQMEKGDGR